MSFLKNNKKKILVIMLIVILLLILFGILFMIKVMLNLQDAEKESYQPSDSKRHQNIQIKSKQNVNNLSFLILGLDKKDSGTQRTDSIIVATYNVKKNTITMTRIPRDLYIEVDDYKGKINALYETKGLSTTINVIQDYTGIPITNYATTDFDGLTKMIDHVGGIDINSDIQVDDSNNSNLGGNIYINKGKNHLNGKEALGYSRIRYIDNDIERGNRQMDVIKALIKKLTSTSQLTNADGNIKYMSKYVKTDMKISTAIDYTLNLNSTPKMNKLTFKWDQFNNNGEDFVTIDDKERAKMSNELRKNLDLKQNAALVPIKTKP